MSSKYPSVANKFQIKYLFGTLGLLTAFTLRSIRSRMLGYVLAILITVVGRIYPYYASPGDRGAVPIDNAIGIVLLSVVGMVALGWG